MKIDMINNIKNINNIKDIEKRNNLKGNFKSTLKEKTLEAEKKKLKDVSNDLEAIMIKEMFKGMRKSIPESGFVEKSNAREIFEDMYDDLMSEEASETNSFGLSKLIYNQMEKYL